MATLKIIHNHANGTTLEGSEQHDGVLEIVQKHGFTWRHWAGIHIRGSRDRMAKTWKINAAAEALRAAGHEVTIEIDNTPRPTKVVEDERKERVEARAERLGERSGKATAEGDGRLQAARRITDGIPFGQPVQPPGHHSRKAHLNALDRADNHRAKAVEAWRKGEYLVERAKGVIANQKHREDPRTTMRRIETLEVDKRRIERELNGYKREHKHKGKVIYTETHKPAEGARRDDLNVRLAHVEEQLTHWRGQLDAQAESGTFVPWGPEHFRKDDLVNVRGAWCRVRRVNRKSVSVPWIVGSMSSGEESAHSDTVPWDDIGGRRRDGMQWDAPNGEPWPVELAKKMARWRGLQSWMGRSGNDYSTDAIFKRIHIQAAQRIALGLDTEASDAEVEAYLVLVDDVETSRRVREAFVDIYDRLAAGEKVPDVQASVTPLNLTPEWRMPDREPEDRIAHRSIFARHDFAQVQAGDLIVGWYDNGRDTPLRRGFCGPVAQVSEVNDRREAGEWITITLVDGQETTCQTYRWFAVHPAGTWENADQAAEPDTGEQVDQLPADLEPAALAVKVARYRMLRQPGHTAHMRRQQTLAADPDKADEFGAELDAWAERDAQIAESVFGGHLLRPAEIAEVGNGRPVFDGCTGVYLGERYGDRVRHVMGVGWFLDLPTGDKATDDGAEPDQVDQLPAGPEADVAEPEPAAEPVAEVVAEPSAAERWQALVSGNIHGGNDRDTKARTRRMGIARRRVHGVPDDYALNAFTERHPGTYEEKAAAYLAAYAALLAVDGAKRTHPAEPEPTPDVAPPPAVAPAVAEVDVEPDPWGEQLDLLGV